VAAITRADPLPRLRLALVGLAVVSLAVLIVQRLYWYQIADHDTFVAMASDEHQQKKSLPARRGALLDSSGHPIAVNVMYDALYAYRPEVGNVDRAATVLSDALGLPKDELAARIGAANTHWTAIVPTVPANAATQIEHAELTGIELRRVPAREYPEGSTAAQLLGFIGADGKGLSGIELTFDQELSGTPGFMITERDTIGSEIALGRKAMVPPVAGSDIHLTIDRYVQRMAEQRLAEAVKSNKATGGVIIVMEPSTGAVLAMAADPTYSLTSEEGYDPQRPELYKPLTVTDTYEPGSVMKLMTMAGAIEEGLITPDGTYYQDTGVAYVDGVPIKNWDGGAYGRVSMREVIVHSLNTGTQWVAGQLGPERFYKYMDAFGFGQLSGVRLNGEAPGAFRKPGETGWTRTDLATNSYGQSISVTPLQMITAIAAIGNHGVLMRPQLVREIRGPEGVERMTPEPIRQVVSPKTADTVLDMMVSHWRQSAFTSIQIAGYTLATKSGTADIPGPGGYSSGKTYASMVGFGPIPNPRFVIMVRLDRPEAVYGGTVAAPVLRELANDLFSYYRIPPTENPSSRR